MKPTSVETASTGQNPAPTGRRRWPLVVLVLVLVLVTAAPSLLSLEPGRSWVLAKVFPTVQGTVSARSATFGWIAPLRIEGLEIRSPAGDSVVQVDSVQADVPAWRFVIPPADLGRLVIDKPHVTVTVQGDNSSTLEKTFPPVPAGQGQAKAGLNNTALAVEVRKAMVSWKLPASDQTWSITPIEFRARVAPAEPGSDAGPRLVIEPSIVLDHAKLTPEMCRDLFVFAAPVFANVTNAQGEASLALAGGEFPLRDPRQGKLSGELSLHDVTVGPGPLVASLTKRLPVKVVNEVHLAKNDVVPFELAEGKVRHENLEFGVGNLRVQTEGSVGLDRTIDLTAHVRLQFAEGEVANRPFLRTLSEQGLRLPIKGTLDKPEVDAKEMGQETLDLVGSLLGNFKENQPESVAVDTAHKVFDLLKQRGLLAPKEAAPAGDPAARPPLVKPEDAVDLGKAALGALQDLAKKRREQANKEQGEPGTEGETPKKRPLGKLLERLKESAAPKPDSPPEK